MIHTYIDSGRTAIAVEQWEITENKSSQAPVRLSYYGIYLVYNTSASSERLGLERTLDNREQIEIVDQCLLHRTTALTVRTGVWGGTGSL